MAPAFKMGSDESQFNVSLIVRDKVTRQCPQNTTFLKREESGIELRPSVYQPNAFPLGQTGSRGRSDDISPIRKENHHLDGVREYSRLTPLKGPIRAVSVCKGTLKIDPIMKVLCIT